jgi:hypothetical protein
MNLSYPILPLQSFRIRKDVQQMLWSMIVFVVLSIYRLRSNLQSAPFHIIAELFYLSLRLLACVAFLPSSTRRTRSTILEYFGFRKSIVSCSMASPIDTDKPGVTPDDDHNGETIINVADTTGIPGDASDSEASGEHQAQNAKGRTPA